MHSKCVEAADIKTNLRSKKPDSIRKLASFSAFNFQYNYLKMIDNCAKTLFINHFFVFAIKSKTQEPQLCYDLLSYLSILLSVN